MLLLSLVVSGWSRQNTTTLFLACGKDFPLYSLCVEGEKASVWRGCKCECEVLGGQGCDRKVLRSFRFVK